MGNAIVTGNWQETYENITVNGHAGYTTEWRGSGALDKPVIVVLGYDPADDSSALDAANNYATLIAEMNTNGYDIIIFDYLDGDADLKYNAENLADFIRYLDDRMRDLGFTDSDGDTHSDYELAVVGGSMGGIVTRTMFVQEYESMGVNIFITVDSPHYGVYLSSSISWLAAGLNNQAGQQMLHGSSLYNQHYGWLESIEANSWFHQNVIEPMNTGALALSNGESRWKVSWSDEVIHTKYHTVSSYFSSSLGNFDFIPYHSAIYADNTGTTSSLRWGYTYYSYKSTATSYFDEKIQNPRDEHGGHEYVVRQAMDLAISMWE
jgi:hypothetical protein